MYLLSYFYKLGMMVNMTKKFYLNFVFFLSAISINNTYGMIFDVVGVSTCRMSGLIIADYFFPTAAFGLESQMVYGVSTIADIFMVLEKGKIFNNEEKKDSECRKDCNKIIFTTHLGSFVCLWGLFCMTYFIEHEPSVNDCLYLGCRTFIMMTPPHIFVMLK